MICFWLNERFSAHFFIMISSEKKIVYSYHSNAFCSYFQLNQLFLSITFFIPNESRTLLDERKPTLWDHCRMRQHLVVRIRKRWELMYSFYRSPVPLTCRSTLNNHVKKVSLKLILTHLNCHCPTIFFSRIYIIQYQTYL